MTGTGKNCKKNIERVKNRKVLTLFVLMSLFIVGAGLYEYYTRTAEVILTVENLEIVKGQDVPVFKADISVNGNEKAFINRREHYTIGDLVEDLKQPGAYSIKCEGDIQKEGIYEIKLSLNDTLKKYQRKGVLKVQEGTLNIKNPVGEWEGEKFRKYDGTYVENEFVISNENTYYMNEEGKKAYGWLNIHNQYYYFDETGIMQKEFWVQDGEEWYYLTSTGAMATGWLEIEGNTYYFQENGEMVTGQLFLGMALCTFDDTGKLVEKTASIIDPDKPMIALTFDDGPGSRTMELLEALKEHNARATFFMLGSRIDKYPEVLLKMKEIGCELGNHSYDHPKLSDLKPEEVKAQMEWTNEKIRNITGYDATVMRPPYGAINDTVKANAGMPMILWNIDTLDWKTRNAEMIKESIIGKIKDGDILLLHDIHTETIDAAIELIPLLQEEGYQLVTVSEMAAMKQVQMNDGEKYTDF